MLNLQVYPAKGNDTEGLFITNFLRKYYIKV